MRPFLSPSSPDCPQPPPSRQSTFARTLHRACLIAGGVDPLAAHLEVSVAALRAWMDGESEPPEPVFLAALEIVLLHVDEAGPAQ